MSEVLPRSSVQVVSGSATQEQAMRTAADQLVAAGAVTDAYFNAMLEREASVSTYMGNGLAIPHGTNDAKEEILRSGLAVTRYDGGVDWAGEPVTFVIGIAGQGDAHLEILSNIAIMFSDEDEVAKLAAASSADELYELLSTINDAS